MRKHHRYRGLDPDAAVLTVPMCIRRCRSGKATRAGARTPVPVVGLLDAVGVSSRGAWAACGTGCSGENQTALILRWNGMTWTRSPSPIRGNLYAMAVGPCGTASAAGAAGSGYFFHPRQLILCWAGRARTRVPCPAPPGVTSLYALAAISSRNAWAVDETGGFFNPHPRPAAQR